MNPSILWAQDRTHLFITIEIHNFNNQNIIFSEKNVNIKGISNNIDFNITIDFNNNINVEESKWLIKQNCIELKVLKSKSLYWHKLTKNKQNNVKIDWQKWRDEDEDDEIENNNMINDFSQFKNQLPNDFLNQNLEELLGNQDELFNQEEEDVEEDAEEEVVEDTNMEKSGLETLKIDELPE